MMALVSDHVNVYSSCIALLDLQGWKVEIDPCPYEIADSHFDFYIATRNGTTIRADDPLRLLGLAALDQYHQPHGEEPYWWAIESTPPNLLDRLDDEALERSFFIYKEKFPKKCKQLILKAIKDSKKDPSLEPCVRLGISKKAFEKMVTENSELKDFQ